METISESQKTINRLEQDQKNRDSKVALGIGYREPTEQAKQFMESLKEETINKGLRFNKGKLRYDLFEPHAMEELAKVFTMGCNKYGDRNWEKGMNWQTMLASLERHKEAFKKGEDYDKESGFLHMAHVAWNALALVSYYSLYPQGDDRPHEYLTRPKIGLDIDEVLCDWLGSWCERYGYELPESWYFDYEIRERFRLMNETGELAEFYSNLKPNISPSDLNFEPCAYITSRPVSTEVTMKWIADNGFPQVPVITVPVGGSKVDAIKKVGIEIFVDDNYYNFVDLNRNGICCYLLDRKHNQKFEVGHKRIKSLKELIK